VDIRDDEAGDTAECNTANKESMVTMKSLKSVESHMSIVENE
jgi:hypothetical protein